ncbi:phenylalanyl-tRNA synthetase beta chain [Bradyrhizobium elkanii]
MKFTLSWLKEHLDTDEPLEKLADKLTMIGLEVENIEDKAKALAPFTIARVISAEQHPNADRLRVCMVDTGDGAEPVQVVCGAPNARAGLISVFSPPGTYIPGKNITLGVGTIRGVESRGMLCSAAELQISEDHDGIMELPADAPLGKGYADWAGLGDPTIEINLTPNRQDCTGVHGIARDLSAADMGKFKDPGIKPIKGEFPCPVEVKVEDATLCPGFALRLVRGVKNGPSPEWLQKRLTSIGLRPINALVDITNFMTYDRARPLHVFDAKKVQGNLTVRRAKDGETLLALDGRTYTLDSNICVIADEHGVESLAGIMGGEASGCDDNTTDVLIESALWNEINIAQTGRKLGINSDARYRFERGVDPAFMVPGLELATKLVLELCGGTPSENVVVGKQFGEDRVIDFPLSEVKRLAGIEVPLVEVKLILTRLGFMLAGNGPVVKIAIPSWRTDVHGKADIVEEIVRIVGVDKVPMTPFERGEEPRKPVLTPMQLRTRRAKRALGVRGMVEAVTWSFITNDAAKLFGGGQSELVLANPIAADLSDMRPSLLPGLVAAVQANINRGYPDVALFEVGQVFRGDRPRGPAGGRLRRAPWLRLVEGDRTALDRLGCGGCDGCQGRRLRRAGGRRRAGAGAADRARRPGLAASGTLRHHPDRPAERARILRRAASACRRGARRRRPDDRVRGDPRAHPARQAAGDARQAGAGTLGIPAGVARLRLHRRSQRQGGRHRPRGAECRQEADHRCDRVRRLRRQGHRSRQEVDRDRGNDPAAREDHDRPGDRRGRGQGRHRGDQEDRRHAARVM